MRRIIKSITLLAIMAIALPSFGQGLKAFKLKNGLSVYIWCTYWLSQRSG